MAVKLNKGVLINAFLQLNCETKKKKEREANNIKTDITGTMRINHYAWLNFHNCYFWKGLDFINLPKWRSSVTENKYLISECLDAMTD